MKKEISIGYSVRKIPRKLPIVLTREQVWKIICASENLKHRLILMTTYAAGLRASEVIALKPKHIESERMLIKVEDGKGRKDRYTMLSVKLLDELRHYYRKNTAPKHTCSLPPLRKRKISHYRTKLFGASTKRPEKVPVLKKAQVFTP